MDALATCTINSRPLIVAPSTGLAAGPLSRLAPNVLVQGQDKSTILTTAASLNDAGDCTLSSTPYSGAGGPNSSSIRLPSLAHQPHDPLSRANNCSLSSSFATSPNGVTNQANLAMLALVYRSQAFAALGSRGSTRAKYNHFFPGDLSLNALTTYGSSSAYASKHRDSAIRAATAERAMVSQHALAALLGGGNNRNRGDSSRSSACGSSNFEVIAPPSGMMNYYQHQNALRMHHLQQNNNNVATNMMMLHIAAHGHHHSSVQEGVVKEPNNEALETLGSSCLERRKNKSSYFDASALTDPDPVTLANRRTRGGVTEPFPEKLYRMVLEATQDGREDILSFYAHGRAFGIHKPEQFASEVMPKYFKQSRLSSFQRQLNLYGFTRINTGPDAGGYYHELFLRGRPALGVHIRRVGVPRAVPRRRGVKAHDATIDPDFYAMPLVLHAKLEEFVKKDKCQLKN